MLEIHKLSPRSITFGYLDVKILDYFDKNKEYPYRITLNRDQIEQFLELVEYECDIKNLCFRGIPVEYCVVEQVDTK